MIEIKALSFNYSTQLSFDFPDFSCDQGDNLLILGQSGCGKTTLLHLLSGLLLSKKGSIVINGTDITKLSETEMDFFRGQNIGIVFQKSHLINGLSVKENLLTAQFMAGNKQNVKDIEMTLNQLDLSHKIDQKPAMLSIGEQQRVSIAMALINRPKLILADEPTSSLDDKNCDKVVDLLKEQSMNYGASLLIVTHDIRLKTKFNTELFLEDAKTESII